MILQVVEASAAPRPKIEENDRKTNLTHTNCSHGHETEGSFEAFLISSIRRENPNTQTFVLDHPLQAGKSGQFCMVWLPEIGEKPFSIAGADPLAFTISDVGPLSHAVSKLGKGDRLWVRGPLGHGFELVGTSHLLVGGGYGAAPLAYLAADALALGHDVAVCLGAKTTVQLIFADVFSKMGATVRLATEDGSSGTKGLVTESLLNALVWELPSTIYACGPTGMLMAVAAEAQNADVPAQLSFEGVMRCGVGLCGSCELPEDICAKLGLAGGWLPCWDGPVAKLNGLM
jgi:dihydroorotate dehydrogenase electron transfer subunit